MKFFISHCTGSCLPICRVAVECSLPVAGHFRYGTGHDLSHENVWAVIEKLSQFPMWKGNNRYIRHFSCHYFDVSNVRTMKNICMQKKNEIVPKCQLASGNSRGGKRPIYFDDCPSHGVTLWARVGRRWPQSYGCFMRTTDWFEGKSKGNKGEVLQLLPSTNSRNETSW